MKKIIKYILLGLFIFLFCNSMIVNAKETIIRTCKYEKSNLGSINDVYIEIKFTKNCSGCSIFANIDLEKSYYYDTQYKKFIHFDTVKKINTLQFSQNNTYNNEKKDNCPEAIFVGVRDGSWVTVKMGTKAEMQSDSDTNVAVGGYDYHYRDRYVITKTGVLTDGDIIAIDNRLIERNTNIKLIINKATKKYHSVVYHFLYRTAFSLLKIFFSFPIYSLSLILLKSFLEYT